MIFNFFFQLLLCAAFVIGFMGIGLVILRVFKMWEGNILLYLAISFFVSLCTYVGGAIIFLFLVKGNSLTVLKAFSLIYIIISYSIIAYFLFKGSKVNKISLTNLVTKYGVIFLGLLFVIFVFFLGAYNTGLLDEWQHRPVIKFFVANGEFPFKNPYNPGENFFQRYHYGLYIPASAIQLLTKIGVSEALDVMKLCFVVASYLLFYGLLFEWSKREYFSLVGTILIFFSGASFFLMDGFSVGHWYVWGAYMRTMNYPFLYLLLGITWVNLPLTLAFLIFIEDIFYNQSSYSFRNITLLIFLMLGFFLISELFAIFLILCLFVLTLHNILRRKISLPRIAILSGFFVVTVVVGIYFSGGAIVGALKNMSISSLISLRNPSSWGYSSQNDIISPIVQWFLYLRNFLLEFVIGIFLLYGLFCRRINIGQQPLMFFGILITLIVPFIFSTPMGDINLYKLTAFGIILLHLLFFYYFSHHRNTKFFSMVIVLFVFGSLPVVLTNYNIQFGKNGLAWAFRCSENELCYDKSSVEVLKQLQKKVPEIKYVLTAPQDASKVVDVTNAYAVNFSGMLNYSYLEQKKVQYIYVTPNLRLMLNNQQLEYLGSLEKIAEKGKFEILKSGVSPGNVQNILGE